MKSFNDRAKPPPAHQKELVNLIASLAPRRGAWQVFADFVELGAISISNAVDHAPKEKREARYMEIIKRYDPSELKKFPEMLARLTLALEEDPRDVLGQTFHDLALHNKWAGQFFSPMPVARLMAAMTLEGLEEKRAERGFVTALEPAVGGGAMVIALAHEMRAMGINYQRHLHVTAVDIDAKCVHMAYLQCSLLHIPAIIVHGDTLRLKEFDHWRTPAHFMGRWDLKLSERNAAAQEEELEPAPTPDRDEQAPPPTFQMSLF